MAVHCQARVGNPVGFDDQDDAVDRCYFLYGPGVWPLSPRRSRCPGKSVRRQAGIRPRRQPGKHPGGSTWRQWQRARPPRCGRRRRAETCSDASPDASSLSGTPFAWWDPLLCRRRTASCSTFSNSNHYMQQSAPAHSTLSRTCFSLPSGLP